MEYRSAMTEACRRFRYISDEEMHADQVIPEGVMLELLVFLFFQTILIFSGEVVHLILPY